MVSMANSGLRETNSISGLNMCCASQKDKLYQPFHFQDLISNSPYCLLHNVYVSLENLILDQLIIP